MQKFTKNLNKNNGVLKANPIIFLIAVIFGLSLGFLVYSSQLQFPLMSKRNLAIGIGISALAAIFFFLIYQFWASPLIERLDKKRTLVYLVLSMLLAFGFSLFADIQPLPYYFLYPETDLQIEINSNDCHGSCDDVRLLYIRNDFRDISFSELKFTGFPQISNDSITFSAGESGSIKWRGVAGQELSITFGHTDVEQDVKIRVNGQEYVVQLEKGIPGEVTKLISLPGFPYHQHIFTIVLTVFLVFVFLTFFIGISSPQPYFFILLGIWILTLLIYWPGIIGKVGPVEIQELSAGDLDDWHPVAYTVLLYISDRFLFSLSAFLVLQMIAASIVFSLGFSYLENQGANKRTLIVLSFVTALLPSNLLSLLTLTKDIPFSVAMVGLQVILIMVFCSDGKWLLRSSHLLLFILTALSIILFRYNGLPALAATFFALFIFFSAYWKRILFSLITVITIYAILTGPVFSWIGVEHVASGHLDNIILHHISAHVKAGTPLQTEDYEYLDSLLPVEEWDYNCCTNQTMLIKAGFKLERFHENSKTNRQVVLNLLTENPEIDLKHMLCASDIVWKINESCTRGIPTIEKIRDDYYWTKNSDPSYFENSKLPFLVKPVSKAILYFESNPLLYLMVWRPALYLYLSIALVVWYIFKFRTIKVLTLLAPIIGQSAFLFLFNRVQIFRYQYCVVLMTLIIIAFAFLPKSSFKKAD